MSMFMGMNKEELIEKFEKHTASEEEVLRSIAGLHDYFSKKEKEFAVLVIEQSNSNNGIQPRIMRTIENRLAEKLRKLP